MFCYECGAEMWIDAYGISHHASDDTLDGIDYDLDADHVAFVLSDL